MTNLSFLRNSRFVMARLISLRFMAMIFAASVIALVPQRAGAEDMREIDCSGSQFSFPGEGYRLDCEQSAKQVRAGESSGATVVDVMTIGADAPSMFLTVIGMKVNATRLYLEYRNLGSNFRDTFKNTEVEDWKTVGNKNGYDIAEFKAVISGVPSQCIAIQRYTNAAWTGFKRKMIGMGCSPVGLEPVYAALSKLQAPGD